MRSLVTSKNKKSWCRLMWPTLYVARKKISPLAANNGYKNKTSTSITTA